MKPGKVLCRTPSTGQTYAVWQFLKEKRKKDSGSENLPPVEKKGLNRITSLA